MVYKLYNITLLDGLASTEFCTPLFGNNFPIRPSHPINIYKYFSKFQNKYLKYRLDVYGVSRMNGKVKVSFNNE